MVVGNQDEGHDDVAALRAIQEQAILSNIHQNYDAWIVQNMRGILKDNSITKYAFSQSTFKLDC